MARTLQSSGKRPETTRREDPINTATTSAADSTTTSHEAESDAATVRSLVHVRELGPGDGDVVDEVFAGLSPRSRYLRFQGPVAELSAATRRSLTALDGRTHVALAAFTQGRPIGIVRIIDLGDGRGELAIEIVDRWQGRGVGTRLLQAARDRAADMGYRELVGEMLVVNTAAHAALRRVFRVTQVSVPRRRGSSGPGGERRPKATSRWRPPQISMPAIIGGVAVGGPVGGGHRAVRGHGQDPHQPAGVPRTDLLGLRPTPPTRRGDLVTSSDHNRCIPPRCQTRHSPQLTTDEPRRLVTAWGRTTTQPHRDDLPLHRLRQWHRTHRRPVPDPR